MSDAVQLLRLCPHSVECDICHLYMLAESMADITNSEEAARDFFARYRDFAIHGNGCRSIRVATEWKSFSPCLLQADVSATALVQRRLPNVPIARRLWKLLLRASRSTTVDTLVPSPFHWMGWQAIRSYSSIYQVEIRTNSSAYPHYCWCTNCAPVPFELCLWSWPHWCRSSAVWLWPIQMLEAAAVWKAVVHRCHFKRPRV